MSGANVDNVFDRVETKVKGLLDENAQLREQNRVLREALERLAILGNEPFYGNSAGNVIAQKALGLPATVHMTKPAAITATSQPVSEKGDYSHHPAFDEYGEHR
jgi:cell division septum initiation protein DivIVA